ncbi:MULTISPECIES: hypothetical protein [unclassified Streptomyces]|uniref:hypothetical protein n=1 Tax=unclassified Streptomyces TaxID=2593676 RepID=UPI000DD8FFEC|nr:MULTISPECIES: hypothetical protein [unclassified Streptomyces]QZZ27569.1 hypothetical protein A7X85_15975 [Streptomyces sp. ST1015]
MPPETAPPIDALTLLALPDLNDLPQPETRGVACVWCGIQITTATAVDLGERRHSHYSTFPRACHLCVHGVATQALRSHAGMCEQCVDDNTRCETATALWCLIRDTRREGSP